MGDLQQRGFSRRSMLGATGAGLLAGAGAVGAPSVANAARAVPESSEVVPFYDISQSGIATPMQNRLHFAAFDLLIDNKDDFIDLMKKWTAAAAALQAGEQVEGVEESTMTPSGLTLTIGYGATMFDKVGLGDMRPQNLIDMPRFPGDQIDESISNGDLAIQATSDDPQAAMQAIRTLATVGKGAVKLRWQQDGFNKASKILSTDETPRNLFGFKDGTENISVDEDDDLAHHVWIRQEGPLWMAYGTYMVVRKITMDITAWDDTSVKEQEAVIGRLKESGAPIGKTSEADPVKLGLLPKNSHVALAYWRANGLHRMLRRGYSYSEGSTSEGGMKGGLFFIAYVRNPKTQFVDIQQKLAANDALNDYITHVSTGLFAVPPGVKSAGDEALFWGSTMFRGTGDLPRPGTAGVPRGDRP